MSVSSDGCSRYCKRSESLMTSPGGWMCVPWSAALRCSGGMPGDFGSEWFNGRANFPGCSLLADSGDLICRSKRKLFTTGFAVASCGDITPGGEIATTTDVE